MKITLETTESNDKIICIKEIKQDDLDIFSLWEDLISPILLSFGYQQGSINDLINKYEDEKNEEESIKPVEPNRVPGNDINTGKF